MMCKVASQSRALLCSSNDPPTEKLLFQHDVLIALDLPKRLAVASYLSEGDCKGTLPRQLIITIIPKPNHIVLVLRGWESMYVLEQGKIRSKMS